MKKTDKYHLSQDDTFLIETASPLHDIGKISIPNEILNKPGKLTEEEKRVSFLVVKPLYCTFVH